MFWFGFVVVVFVLWVPDFLMQGAGVVCSSLLMCCRGWGSCCVVRVLCGVVGVVCVLRRWCLCRFRFFVVGGGLVCWWWGLCVVFGSCFGGELVLRGSGSLRFFVVCVFMFGSFCR